MTLACDARSSAEYRGGYKNQSLRLTGSTRRNCRKPCPWKECHSLQEWWFWLAGKYAAEANDAEIVDPREYYQGTLRRTLKKYRHIGKTIPAMGYSPKEVILLSSPFKPTGAQKFIYCCSVADGPDAMDEYLSICRDQCKSD